MQKRAAQAAQREAERQKQSALSRLANWFIADAQRLQEKRPHLGLLLGVEAVRASDLPSVESDFREILGKLGGSPLVSHQGLVRSVAFDPNRGRLASAGQDGTVRLWDLAAGSGV